MHRPNPRRLRNIVESYIRDGKSEGEAVRAASPAGWPWRSSILPSGNASAMEGPRRRRGYAIARDGHRSA